MITEAQIFCQALVQSYKVEDKLASHLPPSYVQASSFTPSPSPPSHILSLNWVTEHIHPSWWQQAVKPLPYATHSLFYSLLPPKKRKSMGVSGQASPLSPWAHAFLLHTLYQLLVPPTIPPPALLPPSPLHVLLEWTSSQRLWLIDMLAMHDLAAAVRHIVDKKRLQAIHHALQPSQQAFLEVCLSFPPKGGLIPLELTHWDGSSHTLQALLHTQGLYRLAKGVLSESPQFLWHLLHRLDTARARCLQKGLAHKPQATSPTLFRDQILHIVQRVPAR